jgi:hypothetical protein
MGTTPNYSDNNVGWVKGKKYEAWVIAKYPTIYPKRTLTLLETEQEQWHGETKEGIEIKHDDLIFRYDPEGRVYVEMYEKSRGENPCWIPSGIFKADNTTMILIGDYSRWFLFSKRYLVWLQKLDPPFIFKCKPTYTSKGFCIPLVQAKHLCLDYVRFDEDGKRRNDGWTQHL